MAEPHIETLKHPPTVERAAENAATHLGQHTTDQKTTESTEQASGGLPQFQFQHWPGQIAYLVILFAILYLLMSKVFAPRIRRIFDERRSTIDGALASARTVQVEAAAQAEVARQALAEARARAQKTAADAKAEANHEAKARQGELEAELSARLDEAEGRIRASRDAAMGNVGAVASDTAQAILEKLTGAPASADAVSAALANLQG
jgi:F-type H+-transporting ATPase subunit b